jgi:inositol transport system ATP-binding protein
MLAAVGLSKKFGDLTVLKEVSVEFRPGEVHALMGENGAGKSTLMKILAGLYQPDAGQVRWRGQEVQFSSPLEALEAGIAMIHQELMPIPDLTVAENILLGREPVGALGWIDRSAMQVEATRLLQVLDSNLNPQTRMRDLTVAQTQVVEIAKALGRQADVILMDEPTAALSDHECAALFKAIRQLCQRGVAVVYTTHKMDEVFQLADRITVLRDGAWVETQSANQFTPASLISHMVGRDLATVFPALKPASSDVVLEVKSLTREPYFRNISFKLHRGEVLGLAGLMGAGRTELVSALYGLLPATSGEIILKGKSLQLTNPTEALAQGIGMVTEDRKGLGIIPELSVQQNLTLTALQRYTQVGVIQHSAETAVAEAEVNRFAIKTAGLQQPIRQLSGGNQQKVLLARMLLDGPDIVILDEPTRGIDIGAKSEIYAMIAQLTAAGKAMILVSSELPEVLALSHRIVVLRQGDCAAEFTAAEATPEKVLSQAMPL